MEPELWNRVEELFQAALALPQDERAAFLREACPNDWQLRSEVESLLDNVSDGNSFLEESPAAGAALSAGQTLGNFEILERIGTGGMGEVYRARDLRLRREVAIKVLPTSFADDPEKLARFEREARAASALNHPNIVCVYDVGRAGAAAFIVSELVHGESLRRSLAKGPLPLKRAIEIALEIADGLAAAHAAGLIHRDVKPENIMLARDGRVKILDFGLAKRQFSAIAAVASGSTEITRPGVIAGTPAYMSPEQIVGGTVDQRSDLFSLGVVAYELFGGKRPFGGDSFVAVMNAVLVEEPAELPAAIPPGISKLVYRCLEKQPERRLQAAADFGFVLHLVRDSKQVSAPKKRKRCLFWTSLSAAMVLAATGLVWLGRHMAKPPPPGITATLQRLTWDSGLTAEGAISPDGKLVAYVSDRDTQNNLNLYVQQIDSGGVVRLTDGPADDHDPAFSPDGSQIAFGSERNPAGVYEVSSLGGEARLLVSGGSHPRFSPDGRYLVYSLSLNGQGNSLLVQAISGGPPVEVSHGCSSANPGAAWSPDSLHVLFIGSCDAKIGAWLGSIDGRRPKLVKNSYAFITNPKLRLGGSDIEGGSMDEWLGDPPRLLVPVHERDASLEAALPVARDGEFLGPLQPLVFGPVRTNHGSASAGGRVVLSSFEQSSNVWRLAVNAAGQAIGTPAAVTGGPVESWMPSVSRDGEKIAFIAKQGGIPALCIKNLKTSSQRTLVRESEANDLYTPVFNPAGDRLLYATDKYDAEVATNGGLAQKLPFGDVTDWSSQDELLVLAADDYHSIRVVDRATFKSSELLVDGQSSLFQAHFSFDGHWGTFNSTQGRRSRIYAVPCCKAPIPKKDWIAVTDGTHWDDKPHFSPDGKLIFFTSDRDGHRCIWAQALTADMHPLGNPFPVYHSHASRRSLGALQIWDLQLSVAPGMIVFNQGERTGNIWLLDPK